MNIEVLADAESVAREAASIIAQEGRISVSARGRFVLAVSGDSTSLRMLRALSQEQMVWERLHVVQVDECVEPTGDSRRCMARLRECLLDRSLLRPAQIHTMPAEARDIEVAAARYALSLHRVAGSPPVLDLVHLTLGADGRAASLLPDDPVLDVTDKDVALTGTHEGRRWMTLTYPILNRSRFVLWSVTGADKAEMLRRLQQQDDSIPAGRVRSGMALILADCAASGQLTTVDNRGG